MNEHESLHLGDNGVPTCAGYDRWAEIYDSDDNPLVMLEEEHFGPLVGDVAGLDVADVGSGTGRHALRWAAAGARVTAVDFSEAMLNRARAKPGAEAIRFVCHDLFEPLPLASAAFDRVLCCLVLDHIADLDKFFAELHRLCRPHGYVVISAMHPAMLLKGVQARFIDPATGSRVALQSYCHQIADFLTSALQAGLVLDHISEHAVDADFAARCPRAAKYLGWPLLLLMRFTPGRPQAKAPVPESVEIRRAEPADAAAITEIYNEAILTTTASFDTEPKTVAERTQWLQSHGDRHPVLVALCDANVVGWASLSKWSDRTAYDDTAETSFYVKAEFRGRGIGRRLKMAIIDEARCLKFHTLIARVAEESRESLHLNESLGFVHVGTLRQVGRKFGRLLDVHILQKILD